MSCCKRDILTLVFKSPLNPVKSCLGSFNLKGYSHLKPWLNSNVICSIFNRFLHLGHPPLKNAHLNKIPRLPTWVKISTMAYDTVDGKNPAPVDMVNIPLFARFHTCWVVQDFFHQQFVWKELKPPALDTLAFWMWVSFGENLIGASLSLMSLNIWVGFGPHLGLGFIVSTRIKESTLPLTVCPWK